MYDEINETKKESFKQPEIQMRPRSSTCIIYNET